MCWGAWPHRLIPSPLPAPTPLPTHTAKHSHPAISPLAVYCDIINSCTGVAHRYFGTAVGKGRQSVKTEIERLPFDQLTCRQAVMEAAKV